MVKTNDLDFLCHLGYRTANAGIYICTRISLTDFLVRLFFNFHIKFALIQL